MVPCFLIASHSEPLEKEDALKEERSTEHLPADQQQVYHELGPLYQKIYLFALNDEERHRVVVYTRRGVTAFEAMNIILRVEERKYTVVPPSPKSQPIAPSARISKGSCQSRGHL